MNVDRLASIVFACGQPGSGKSHELKVRLARSKPDRAILIDPDGEYEGWGYLHTQVEDVARATAYPTFRTRFRPSIDRKTAEAQFDYLCGLARWHVAPEPHQARPPRVAPLTFLVDELADMTGPSFRDAPEGWRWIVKRGRKYGVSVLAASQRPEEIDKTLFNLCSTLHVHRIGDTVTARRLAHSLRVPLIEVEQLSGFAFIERDKNTDALRYADARGSVLAVRVTISRPSSAGKAPLASGAAAPAGARGHPRARPART